MKLFSRKTWEKAFPGPLKEAFPVGGGGVSMPQNRTLADGASGAL